MAARFPCARRGASPPTALCFWATRAVVFGARRFAIGYARASVRRRTPGRTRSRRIRSRASDLRFRIATDPVSDSVATDPVSSPPSLRLCVAALPSGEAATAVATAPENRVFVGSSRRARVWEETRGVGWEEIGELELDGAVVAARFPTDQGEDARDAECGTPSARSAISSDSAASRSLGVVTTSAGTAWSVDVFGGTAATLVQAHPLDIVGIAATRVGARDALATVTADGAARAWDASSATKIVEAHADPDFAAARSAAARVAVAAPDGTHLVVGCGDGSLGVIRIVGAEREPSAFASRIDAHPEGGAVVAAAFAPTPIAPPRAFARGTRRGSRRSSPSRRMDPSR